MSKLSSLLDDDTATTGAESASASGTPLMERIRNAALTPAGRAVLVVVVLGALAFGGYRMYSAIGSGGAAWPRIRVMDPATGDMRWQEVRPGESMPYVNPRTGERSMYIVEYCFDNECGPAGGTPVVLNNFLGVDGPMVCPRCGATVTPHNPRPAEYAGVQPSDW